MGVDVSLSYLEYGYCCVRYVRLTRRPSNGRCLCSWGLGQAHFLSSSVNIVSRAVLSPVRIASDAASRTGGHTLSVTHDQAADAKDFKMCMFLGVHHGKPRLARSAAEPERTQICQLGVAEVDLVGRTRRAGPRCHVVGLWPATYRPARDSPHQLPVSDGPQVAPRS